MMLAFVEITIITLFLSNYANLLYLTRLDAVNISYMLDHCHFDRVISVRLTETLIYTTSECMASNPTIFIINEVWKVAFFHLLMYKRVRILSLFFSLVR